MNRKMLRVRLQLTYLIAIGAVFVALFFEWPVAGVAQSQIAATPTAMFPPSSAYITQTYHEAGKKLPINVRSGPNTVDYPVIGQLPAETTAPALGASPSREWIQIAFGGAPGGVGWVYAANVTLTGSVQIVEPPPTPVPPTIDPTYAVTFEVEPTVTRSPTFTPPAPLVVPTFTPAPVGLHGLPNGAAIIGLGLAGALVLAASLLSRP